MTDNASLVLTCTAQDRPVGTPETIHLSLEALSAPGGLTVGRLQGSRKLVLDSGPGLPGLLSRLHASLHLEPGRGLLLSDHSTNGCYVNDARVEASQPVSLQDGDLLSFGGHRTIIRGAAGALTQVANPLVFRVSGVADLVAAAAQHGMPSQHGQQSEQMAEATLPDSLPQAELEPTERQHPPPLAATAVDEGLPGLPAASAAAQWEGAASADIAEQAADARASAQQATATQAGGAFEAAIAALGTAGTMAATQADSQPLSATWAESVQRQSQDAASEDHPPLRRRTRRARSDCLTSGAEAVPSSLADPWAPAGSDGMLQAPSSQLPWPRGPASTSHQQDSGSVSMQHAPPRQLPWPPGHAAAGVPPDQQGSGTRGGVVRPTGRAGADAGHASWDDWMGGLQDVGSLPGVDVWGQATRMQPQGPGPHPPEQQPQLMMPEQPHLPRPPTSSPGRQQPSTVRQPVTAHQERVQGAESEQAYRPSVRDWAASLPGGTPGAPAPSLAALWPALQGSAGDRSAALPPFQTTGWGSHPGAAGNGSAAHVQRPQSGSQNAGWSGPQSPAGDSSAAHHQSCHSGTQEAGFRPFPLRRAQTDSGQQALRLVLPPRPPPASRGTPADSACQQRPADASEEVLDLTLDSDDSSDDSIPSVQVTGTSKRAGTPKQAKPVKRSRPTSPVVIDADDTEEREHPAAPAALEAYEGSHECPICKEATVAAHSFVPCGHCFCGECIGDWLTRKTTCPECRVKAAHVPTRNRVLDDVLNREEARMPAEDLGVRRLRWQQWQANEKTITQGMERALNLNQTLGSPAGLIRGLGVSTDLAWGWGMALGSAHMQQLRPGPSAPRPFNAWDQIDAMAAGPGAQGNRGIGSPYGRLQATVNAQVMAQQGARRGAHRARGQVPAPPPPVIAAPPPPPPVPVSLSAATAANWTCFVCQSTSRSLQTRIACNMSNGITDLMHLGCVPQRIWQQCGQNNTIVGGLSRLPPEDLVSIQASLAGVSSRGRRRG